VKNTPYADWYAKLAHSDAAGRWIAQSRHAL